MVIESYKMLYTSQVLSPHFFVGPDVPPHFLYARNATVCHISVIRASFIQSFTHMFTQMYNRYIEAENSAKYMPPDGFFIGIKIFEKFNFDRGTAPDPAVGAYNAPADPLVGWGGEGGFPSPFLTFGVQTR